MPMKTRGRPEGEYARKVYAGTQRYLRDLLAQNDRLRDMVESLQADKERLIAKVSSTESVLLENDELRARVAWLESREAHRQTRFSEQYVEVERQNTNLVNLFVASDRLHTTLDRGEVLTAVGEILANLVGSEEIAIFERHGDSLRLVAAHGIDAGRYQTIALGEGPIGRAAMSGEIFVADAAVARDSEDDPAITACIPLVLAGRVTGAIAVFRLLPQKASLVAVDHELFELLATHAAMALYTTLLHSRIGTDLEAVS